MTNIDLKRARELAGMMDRCGCQGIDQHEAASIIRSLCEIVEERDRLREAGQVTAMACLELANTEGLSIRQ